jgi:penicillin-binding protein 1A
MDKDKNIKIIDVHKASKAIPSQEPVLMTGSKGRKKWVLRLFLLALVFFLFFGVYVIYLLRNLPSIESLKNYRPPIITEVYDSDGRSIGEFSNERRIVTPLAEIPDILKHAFIASEDDRFYEHKGLDWHGIARAFVINILAGEVKQGGSTITQQVAKSLLLNPEKSIARKVKEAFLAYRMEKNLTKDEILFLYLNQIYLGYGAYGVATAAENYFSKKLSEINIAESALLAGLIQAPSRYNPFTHMERAKARQAYVLSKMEENKLITPEEKEAASKAELKLIEKKDINKIASPYFVENVRKYLVAKYGNEMILNEGLKVYTTLNSSMQRAAEIAIKVGLEDLDKRQGYRGALETVDKVRFESFKDTLKEYNKGKDSKSGDKVKALVTAVEDAKELVRITTDSVDGVILLEDMKWARKPDPKVRGEWNPLTKPSTALKTGDVILVKVRGSQEFPEKYKGLKKEAVLLFTLEQEPIVEGALIAIDVNSGDIKAMVGGYDFSKSEFNRAIQAKRQPGSAFKPVIYAAAVDKGYTAAKMIVDAPVVFDDPVQELEWRPKNYGGKFSGDTIFRDALIESRNVPTIKIVDDLGIEYVLNYAKKVGVISPLERNLSIALGSSSMTPLELTKVYGVFASGGRIVQPVFIKKILDRDSNILEENVKEPSVLLPQTESQATPVPTVEKATAPEENKNPRENINPDSGQVTPPPYEPHFVEGGVISQETSFIITHLLKEVVHYGTGQRARALGKPTAGKTGTTNDNMDTWFVGYTPDLVAGVWVGFDEKKSLGAGEVGGHTSTPIWLDFMREALKGAPVKDFPVPPGIVFVQIDPKTGKLATDKTKDAIFEAFIEGTQPSEKSGKEVDSQIKNFFLEGQ